MGDAALTFTSANYRPGTTTMVGESTTYTPPPPRPPPPAAPPPKVIPFRMGTQPTAPAAPLPPAVTVSRTAAPMVTVGPGAFTPVTDESAPVATIPTAPATATAPACDCWPWWWMLVAAGAGAAAGYAFTGKDGKKRRKNAARYVCRHVVERIPNPFALLGV